MRLPRLRLLRPIVVTFALLSCTENGPVGPRLDPGATRLNVAGTTGPVRISEFHYDNPGNDIGEAIEISGPAGTDLTNWQIVRYNGSGGAVYTSPAGPTVGGVIPATCGARGVLVFTYPKDGLQNGSPDGFALVDNNNQVVEFLSYEGTFTAVGGPANGMVSQDVGVIEGASGEGTGLTGSPVWSVSRDGAGNWSGPAANTFGACNDNSTDQSGVTVSPVPPATGTVAVGSTVQYQATVKDANGSDITSSSTIVWTTSPEGFATVDAHGLVKGTAAGNTSVVATVGTKSGSSPLTVTGPVQVESGDVVISQVYGGGGNSSATYTNDYIELLNKSDHAVNLAGWSVQYASAAGTTYQVTNLSGTVQPGHYFLVQEAAGTGTAAALPTAEVTGSVNLSGTSGKVILAQTTTAQSGCPTALIVDKVGYGSASCTTEWSASAPGPSNNTVAVLRKGDGCTDTDVSANDFSTGPATPRNGASPQKRCAAPTPLPPVHFSELHYDNTGTDVNEKIEIAGPAGTDLSGWSVVLYGGDAQNDPNPPYAAYNTTDIGVSIPATCGVNGVVVIDYAVNGIRNAQFNGTGHAAGMALIDNNGQVVEFLSYEGSFTALDGPAAGHVSADMGVSEDPPPAAGNSLHRDDLGVWQNPAPQDFGACNAVNATPPAATATITFTGRLATDPALPVGFEDQLFASEKNASGVKVTTNFAWTSLTPAVATIDADGVMHAWSAGTATFQAKADDGTTASYSLQTVNNVFSTSADWSGNLEFGTPTDNDPSDDLIITHDQFTSSYSLAHKTPNWVSAKIDVSHYGTGSDRCDCFTWDPLVGDSAHQYYTTNAWTGVGSTWNRGHLLRSADVEASAGDNSIAYYFSNIAPQSAEMNQGPWAVEENYLGDLAKTGGKDVYEVMGVTGSQGTLKGVASAPNIPQWFWKVAVIVPHGRKLADIRDYNDVQIISVIMPNVSTVNSDWTTYKTTVDAVEALSGYDLLNALPDDIEPVVESNDQVPTAVMAGPDAGVEGSSLTFSGNGSSDPDAGDVLSYAWDFGDNGTASGINPSHTYADNGQYIATLTVRDQIGAKNVTTKVVTISNAAPSVVVDASAPITSGTTFALAGGFADAGQSDGPWTYTVNWGDGSSNGSTPVEGAITASHQYFAAGSYNVTLTVTDKDGGVGSNSITLQVNPVSSTMDATQSKINTSNNGNGVVKVTVLGNSSFTASDVVLSSVRIGNVHPATEGNGTYKVQIADVNHDGIADMVAQFTRSDLAADGDLDGAQLVLNATLTDGRQIQSVSNVSVR